MLYLIFELKFWLAGALVLGLLTGFFARRMD